MLAVGRNVLEIAYHLLGEQTTYRELGIDYFDRYRAETIKAPQPRSTPAPWLPGHSYTSPNCRLRRIFQDRDRGNSRLLLGACVFGLLSRGLSPTLSASRGAVC